MNGWHEHTEGGPGSRSGLVGASFTNVLCESMGFGVVQIIVNGQTMEVSANESVAGLLVQLKLQAGPVAVEVNRELVVRQQHADHGLHAGDQVEVVTLVGGG